MDFQDKVVLVTGASRGIGNILALTFAKQGAKVIINYLKSKKEAEDLEKKIKKLNVEVMVVKADVSKRREVHEMVNKILKRFGRIDILINNAGAVFEPADWMRVSEENWQKILGVNLSGVFNCIRLVAPIMFKQKYGNIINIASLAGFKGTINAPAYSAAKAGVINLTKTFAKELAPFVNVNAVAPGWVLTDWHRFKGRDFLNLVKHQVPMGRIAKIEDVVNVILFLSSEKSSYITGQTLIVDGGASLI